MSSEPGLVLNVLYAYLDAKGSIQCVVQDAAAIVNCPHSNSVDVAGARTEIVQVLGPLIDLPWEFCGDGPRCIMCGPKREGHYNE